MSPAITKDPRFQSYLENIKAKTGKGPQDFVRAARVKGLLAPEVKSGEIVAWLKREFDLGHGHAMAIVVVLRNAMSPANATKGATKREPQGSRKSGNGRRD